MSVKIRDGTSEDSGTLIKLIQSLATHLQSGKVSYKTEYLAEAIDSGNVQALLAEDHQNTIVGYILYYTAFGACTGRFFFMEDFFVVPENRSKGIGSELWKRLAQLSVEKGYKKMEWQVYSWNTDAIKLYKKMGGYDLEDKDKNRHYRLDKDDLNKLAQLPSK